LPRRQQTVEQLVIIGQRDQLTLRDVAQLRAWGQIHRRRKLCEELVWQVKIYIEPLEIAPILLFERVDHKVRKDKAAL
jgi:hypothetical protein